MWSTKIAPALHAGEARRPVRAPPGAGRRRCRRRRRRSPGPSAASRGVLPTRPPFSDDPLLGLGRGAVVDRDLVAFGLQVARHRVAHDAETEERDLRHRRKPFQWCRSASAPRRFYGRRERSVKRRSFANPARSRNTAAVSLWCRRESTSRGCGRRCRRRSPLSMRAVEQRLEARGRSLRSPTRDAGR